jgi:hypothetical protein
MTVAEAVTLIGAVAAAIVSVATAIATLRQGGKLDQVHSLVNGQSIRMESLAQRTGFAEGSMSEVGKHPTGLSAIPPQTETRSGESI